MAPGVPPLIVPRMNSCFPRFAAQLGSKSSSFGPGWQKWKDTFGRRASPSTKPKPLAFQCFFVEILGTQKSLTWYWDILGIVPGEKWSPNQKVRFLLLLRWFGLDHDFLVCCQLGSSGPLFAPSLGLSQTNSSTVPPVRYCILTP